MKKQEEEQKFYLDKNVSIYDKTNPINQINQAYSAEDNVQIKAVDERLGELFKFKFDILKTSDESMKALVSNYETKRDSI